MLSRNNFIVNIVVCKYIFPSQYLWHNMCIHPTIGKLFPIIKGDNAMMSSLYSSASALKSFSEGMGVIGNNLANVSTVGFKQQNLQYADLIYASQGNMGAYNNSQEESFTSLGQKGLGVQVDSVRTLFHSGGFEISNTPTDLAIGGKGFFQVVDADGALFYTKAGNFNFDHEGVLRSSGGLSLSGYKFDENGAVGGALGPIEIDPQHTMPPKETTNTTFIMNLGLSSNKTHDANNPYFSLAGKWNATNTDDPLSSSSYGYTNSMKAYDENGKSQDLNIFFDSATDDGQHKIVEFVVGTNPSKPATDTKDGMHMIGTLTFDGSGKLVNMSAFTPQEGADKSDLNSWVPATLSEDGLPQYALNGKPVTLDLGINSGAGWSDMAESAGAVGTDATKLGKFNPAQSDREATTGFGETSSSIVRDQDGYSKGYMNNMFINENGEMIFSYSNNQSEKLYQIPLARFTSEDGLRREGGNLFSAPDAAGQMEMGTGGTENYGAVMSHRLEMSNVDMSREMVNMIITQRSFQSSSKAITTSDSMLQKAIELKR